MRLKNKKTGEIKDWSCAMLQNVAQITERRHYDSLAKLNEEWEDYEEPKEYWCVDTYFYDINYLTEGANADRDNFNKETGNYFETWEEAELAVRKLKAWKRLKKCGLRFWDLDTVHLKIGYSFENYTKEDIPQLKKDLALIFGGEE